METLADKINAKIAGGMTVYVATYGRITKIHKRFKAVRYWAAAGHDMFKMQGNTLCMIGGYRKDGSPEWVSAQGARISVE